MTPTERDIVALGSDAARYEQIMADGYSTVPEQHERMTGELMSFVNSSCKKYLR